jgi:hypothetical protein
MWVFLINAVLVIGGVAVTVHTLLMANYCTEGSKIVKYVLLPSCVAGGVMMIHGGIYNSGWGVYAAAVTVLPLIAVQIIAWAYGAEVSEQLKKKAMERDRQRVHNFNRIKRDLFDPVMDYQDILTESGKREVERMK